MIIIFFLAIWITNNNTIIVGITPCLEDHLANWGINGLWKQCFRSCRSLNRYFDENTPASIQWEIGYNNNRRPTRSQWSLYKRTNQSLGSPENSKCKLLAWKTRNQESLPIGDQTNKNHNVIIRAKFFLDKKYVTCYFTLIDC